MITPPIALAAFSAAAIAKADPIKTGWASVKFGWPAFIVPFLFAFSPTLIMIGDTVAITMAAVTAFCGVWLVSAALAGHFVGRLSMVMRVAFAIAGLLLMIPAGAFEGAIYTDIAGLVLGLGLIVYSYVVLRREPVSKAAE